MKNVSVIILSFALLVLSSMPLLATDRPEYYSQIGKVKVLGNGPHYLDLGGGRFDAFNGDDALAGNLELRGGKKFHFIGPAIGLLVNDDDAYFGYGAIYADFAIGNVVVNLSWGAGGYEQGDSKYLGGVFQFIENLAIAYMFENGFRTGVRYQHISNADLHKENPGNDSLFISLGYPF